MDEAIVKAALNAKFGDEPDENVQYVIIRGLSALGFQLPIHGSESVIEAALSAVIPLIEAAAFERAAGIAEERSLQARNAVSTIREEG